MYSIPAGRQNGEQGRGAAGTTAHQNIRRVQCSDGAYLVLLRTYFLSIAQTADQRATRGDDETYDTGMIFKHTVLKRVMEFAKETHNTHHSIVNFAKNPSTSRIVMLSISVLTLGELLISPHIR